MARPPPQDALTQLYAVDDMVVSDDGRVVLSAALDTGPSADDHALFVQEPGTDTWRGPLRYGSQGGLEGDFALPTLVANGPYVLVRWDEDSPGRWRPDAVLIR